MIDKVFEGFLVDQHQKGMDLSAASDIFSLAPMAGDPPFRYLMEFKCPTLVRVDDEVQVTHQSVVGLNFRPEHLRKPVDSAYLLTILHPREAFHPNMKSPFICLGAVEPGIGIIEIIYRVYEVLTFMKYTSVEADALNHDACIYARQNVEQFPLDTRPLKRSNPDGGPSGRSIDLHGHVIR